MLIVNQIETIIVNSEKVTTFRVEVDGEGVTLYADNAVLGMFHTFEQARGILRGIRLAMLQNKSVFEIPIFDSDPHKDDEIDDDGRPTFNPDFPRF